MECNRSEAVRVLEMAEQKFTSQDYATARKLALKAQQLFPSLENIAQMIAVIDVHAAAQTRIGMNEKDWYGILQIEPTADDAIVKKQYRKLALFLHPDKNKAIGAESAFKLIGEALQVLSDKVKRLVYDAKRGMHARATHTFSASATNATDGANGWQSQNFQQQQQQRHPDAAPKSNTCSSGNQRFFPQPMHMAPEFHLFTFWTACTSCQMRYQYYRKYENQNLLCPQCRRPFIAKDLSSMQGVNVAQAWPPRAGESIIPGPHSRQSNPHTSAKHEFTSPHIFSNYNSSSSKYFNGFGSEGKSDTYQMFAGPTNRTNGKGGVSRVKLDTHFMSNAAGMCEMGGSEKELLRKLKELRRAAAQEQTKQKNQQKKSFGIEKSHELLAKFFTREGPVQNGTSVMNNMKSKKLNGDSSSSDSEENRELWERVCVKEDSKAYAGQPSRVKRNSSYTSNGKADNLQEVLVGKRAKVEAGVKLDQEADMARRLADIAKNAIRINLNLQRAKSVGTDSAPCLASAKRDNVLGLGNRENTSASAKRESFPTTGKEESISSSLKRENILRLKERHECLDRKAEELVEEVEFAASCSVPDADFHNFDEGREEKNVEVGQIWALYDDKDGMPKYYMKVREVRSRTPFKVLIGWFEIRKPSDIVCELLDLGFSIGCGEFRISSSQVMDSVNSFSHLVDSEKSGKGLMKIYPKKGQIWCIYKDWEAGQQSLRVGIEPVVYSMVEVVTDCSEASGAIVSLLKKVDGFKTIFQFSNEPTIHIPFFELLRFSHRVPAHRLKGTEAPGIPKDSWELDPAAIPSCLLAHPDQNAEKGAAV